jgi:hypothetical protein
MSVYDVQMTYLHMLELNEPAIKKTITLFGHTTHNESLLYSIIFYDSLL